MPFAINGAVAVVSESDSSIHVIGGHNGEEHQSTHYVMNLVNRYYICYMYLHQLGYVFVLCFVWCVPFTHVSERIFFKHDKNWNFFF